MAGEVPVTAAATSMAQRCAGWFRWACRLDVEAFKPGNVSLRSPGHGMTAAQFVTSADAAAPGLCRPGASLGARIEAATAASMAAAGCNTNLGIVLLVAPLVHALERLGGCAEPGPALRESLRAVLAATDVDDAAAAFRAIALAHPGGLGRVAEQDVRDAPSLDLRAAMALAAGRDLIARQYVNGHATVFEFAWPVFEAARHAAGAGGGSATAADPAGARALRHAMQHTYLRLLACGPDSHIVRKHGEGPAQYVIDEARTLLARWPSSGDAPVPGPAAQVSPPAADAGMAGSDAGADLSAELAAWDRSLKARGLNPGTSADLSVATAFVAAACDPVLGRRVLSAGAAGSL